MSKDKKCFDCRVIITHRNYVQLLENGVIVKVCVDCAKKRTNPVNRNYINRMHDSGI